MRARSLGPAARSSWPSECRKMTATCSQSQCDQPWHARPGRYIPRANHNSGCGCATRGTHATYRKEGAPAIPERFHCYPGLLSAGIAMHTQHMCCLPGQGCLPDLVSTAGQALSNHYKHPLELELVLEQQPGKCSSSPLLQVDADACIPKPILPGVSISSGCEMSTSTPDVKAE